MQSNPTRSEQNLQQTQEERGGRTRPRQQNQRDEREIYERRVRGRTERGREGHRTQQKRQEEGIKSFIGSQLEVRTTEEDRVRLRLDFLFVCHSYGLTISFDVK